MIVSKRLFLPSFSNFLYFIYHDGLVSRDNAELYFVTNCGFGFNPESEGKSPDFFLFQLVTDLE